jgi:hypothetical protein
MKAFPILLALVILAQFPWDSPSEKPEVKPPVKGWNLVTYFGTPPTQYSRVAKGIVKAESLGSRASLYRAVGEKQKEYSVLTWRWRISNVVRSAIETRKDRFDAAARIMVIFGKRGGLKMGEPWEGNGLKIEYLWGTRLPKGRVFDNPAEENCKVYVLESGEEKAGQWVTERRNIRKDFEAAFHVQPGELLAIGIQTDTDQSNEMVTAYYSEPVLKKK